MGTATSEREQIEGALTAFEDRDAATASEFWAEDGVFIDPQYPESEYRGPDEVQGALEWALKNIVEQPGLTIRTVWEGHDTVAVEVDTHHLMQDGTEVDFPRVLIIESEHGQVTRWQSYLSFPTPADE